jgi:hypothetical protein
MLLLALFHIAKDSMPIPVKLLTMLFSNLMNFFDNGINVHILPPEVARKLCFFMIVHMPSISKTIFIVVRIVSETLITSLAAP